MEEQMICCFHIFFAQHHMFGESIICVFFLWTLSQVFNFPRKTNQAKTLILRGTLDFQINRKGSKLTLLEFPTKQSKKYLQEKTPKLLAQYHASLTATFKETDSVCSEGPSIPPSPYHLNLSESQNPKKKNCLTK